MQLTQIAVVPAEGGQALAGSPRGPGFRPRAPLRLWAARAGEGADRYWALCRLHDGGVGSTAQVFRGEIVRPSAGARGVAVKLLRDEPLLNIGAGAARDRMVREWELHKRLRALAPPTEGENIAHILGPTGGPPDDSESLPRIAPHAFCLLAEHAIEYVPTPGGFGFTPNVGASPACKGCPNRGRGEQTCRPWLVRHVNRAGGDTEGRLIVQQYAGVTLNEWIQTENSSGFADRPGPGQVFKQLAGRLDLILGVAEAVARLHAGWVYHLDLNPDNVCVTWDGRSIHPALIDFGQAETWDSRDRASTYQERLPGANALFAAPEVRHPTSPIRVQGPKLVDGTEMQGGLRFAAPLLGVPRAWTWETIIPGDVFSVGFPPEDGFFAVIEGLHWDRDGRRCHVTARAFGDGAGALDVFRGVADLPGLLYRNAGPSSDCYSLGLLALAVLAKDVRYVPCFVDEAQSLQRVLSPAQEDLRLALPSGETFWDVVLKGLEASGYGPNAAVTSLQRVWGEKLSKEGCPAAAAVARQVIAAALKCVLRLDEHTFARGRGATGQGPLERLVKALREARMALRELA